MTIHNRYSPFNIVKNEHGRKNAYCILSTRAILEKKLDNPRPTIKNNPMRNDFA